MSTSEAADQGPKRHPWWLACSVLLVVGIVFQRDIAAFFDTPPFDPGPAPAPSGKVFEDDIRHCRWLVDAHWSWREMRVEQGLDLDAEVERALAELRTAGATEKDDPADRRAFLRTLTRFVASLQDGHANVALAGSTLATELQWPFRVTECSDGICVDGVSPAVYSSRKLRRGDRILAVDGREIGDYIVDLMPYAMASTKPRRRKSAVWAIGANTKKARIRVRALVGDAKTPEEFELACESRSTPVPHGSWRSLRRQAKILADGSAYLDPGSLVCADPGFAAAASDERERMCASTYDEYRELFREIATCERLVLDLRCNSGGTDIFGQALCRHLVGDILYYALSARPMRNGKQRTNERWHAPSRCYISRGHGEPRFRGKLAVLIDEHTASAADNIATCLRNGHETAIFVGRPSAGASGAPRSFSLPSTGARVTFCTMRVYGSDDQPIEGRGVVPDLDILPSSQDLRSGRDAALERAQLALR